MNEATSRNPYAAIDPARVAAGEVTATDRELFKVLEYVRAHRNRHAAPPFKSKTLTELAFELAMTKDAVSGALWYWGFIEARDAAQAATTDEGVATRPDATSVADARPQRRTPKARATFSFDPQGFGK